jgi:hypothetical protein
MCNRQEFHDLATLPSQVMAQRNPPMIFTHPVRKTPVCLMLKVCGTHSYHCALNIQIIQEPTQSSFLYSVQIVTTKAAVSLTCINSPRIPKTGVNP